MIFISLTTIPPRFENIFEKLYNFYNEQTVKPDKIILNICHYYKRFNSNIEINNLDEYYLKLINKNILHIIYSDDYGALTKLYPTIKFINDNYKTEPIDIITIDDDCTYINTMIEILIEYSIKFNKKAVLGFFGFNLDNHNNVGLAYVPCTENHCRKLDCLGGVNGMYYNSSFFIDDIDLYEKYINKLSFEDYLCDDEVSCMFMKYKNIDMFMINKNTFKVIDNSAYDVYALSKNNVRERQNKTLHKIIKIFTEL